MCLKCKKILKYVFIHTSLSWFFFLVVFLFFLFFKPQHYNLVVLSRSFFSSRWCRNMWTVLLLSPRDSPPVSCTQCATPCQMLLPAHPRCLPVSPCAPLTCSPAHLCSSSLLPRAGAQSPATFFLRPPRRWDPGSSQLHRRICLSATLHTVPLDPRCPPATARPSLNCPQKHIKESGRVHRFSRMPILPKQETLKTADEKYDIYI